MKRLMVCGGLVLFAFAAAAQAPVDAQEQADSIESPAEVAAQQDADRDCLRYTGSRIVAQRNQRTTDAELDAEAEGVAELDSDDCVSANGRVYSRDDLQRTGHTDIADALRAIDPAIR